MRTKKRTYLITHPWLSFQLDLDQMVPGIWMLLAEAQSKCVQLSGVPLIPKAAKKLSNRYLVEGIYSSATREGNTLSAEEVRERIENNLELPPSREYLGTEIDNLVKTNNLVEFQTRIGKCMDLNPEKIRDLNLLVLAGVIHQPVVVPGETRNNSVLVGNFKAVPAKYCDDLLQRLCNWLHNDIQEVAGYSMAFCVLRAILAHFYLAWIQPFGEGNRRTISLVESQIMLSGGLPTIASHLLTIHFQRTESIYLRKLGALTRSGDKLIPFIEYAVQGFVDGLTEQIEIIRAEQLNIHWLSSIQDSFRSDFRETDRRRKQLLIELSSKEDPIPLADVRYITPGVSKLYDGRNERTFRRDIAWLKNMDLLKECKDGFSANREMVIAFLPPKLHAQ